MKTSSTDSLALCALPNQVLKILDAEVRQYACAHVHDENTMMALKPLA